jgi:hypothetical protein
MERFFILCFQNMVKDKLLETCKRLIETKAGMGSSEYWTNREYDKLALLIKDETGVEVSAFELKQLWSKAGLVEHPNDFTTNALARYAGFENWKMFAMQVLSAKAIATETPSERFYQSPLDFDRKTILIIVGFVTVLLVIGLYLMF